MATCKRFFTLSIFSLIFVFTTFQFCFGEQTLEDIKSKQVSFLDFFLLKYETNLLRRAQVLRGQLLATRVQYSNVIIRVDFDDKKKEILTDIYTVMNEQRYAKKEYRQKLRDCNQVRNLIFYRKHGYTFFTQKRDPTLSEDLMSDIFKEVFFNNLNLEEKEIEFLLKKMFVKVTIFHPIKKTELMCSGKINDYELK